MLNACYDSGADTASAEGIPELIQVAERGDLNALNALLQRRPEPNIRDICDWTPLMKAAVNGHLEAARLLLDVGAKIDAIDKGGYTAMMLATSNNHAAVVGLLLNRGAMVDHQEQTRGWTALIWSAKQGHQATVDVLLGHGADASLRDDSGRSASDWAKEQGLSELHAALTRVVSDPG